MFEELIRVLGSGLKRVCEWLSWEQVGGLYNHWETLIAVCSRIVVQGESVKGQEGARLWRMRKTGARNNT